MARHGNAAAVAEQHLGGQIFLIRSPRDDLQRAIGKAPLKLLRFAATRASNTFKTIEEV